jgi:hypothetical protein
MGCCGDWLAVGVDTVAYTTSIPGDTTLSLADVVPDELWMADKQGEFAKWLMEYVPFQKSRKYLMLEWCKLNKIEYTQELSKDLQIDINL